MDGGEGDPAYWLVGLESVRDCDHLCVLTEVSGFCNFRNDY